MAEDMRVVGGYGVPLSDDGHKDNSPLTSKRVKFIIKNRKAKQMILEKEDMLSALPDSLLLHILSFLDLKSFVRTCVLSSRWKYLWLGLSEFDFCDYNYKTEKIRGFVDWVVKTLGICGGAHLNKVCINFNYEHCFASSINLLVQFVIKNKVKDVALVLHSRNFDLYKLPEMMYSNSSLTNLTLRNCKIAPPPGNIEWKSLTSLSIKETKFSQSMIDSILSGCPVLESLKLTACWVRRSRNFHIHINTPSLKKLVLENWADKSTCTLEIFAPHIRNLSILGTHCMRYRLIGIPSLVSANLVFDCTRYVPFGYDSASERRMNHMKELFGSLQLVEELELGTWIFEALPVLVLSGWQLPKYACKCLTLVVFRHLWSISGILCMLESSLNLETLVINGIGCARKVKDTYDPTIPYLEKSDLNCDLLHLKIVKIESFRGPYLAGAPMLNLLQLLLEKAKVLEKMVINVKASRTSNDFIKIALALNSYPRSSPKAVILFC